MKVDPNAPAFPKDPCETQNGHKYWGTEGMDILTYIATHIASGMRACSRDGDSIGLAMQSVQDAYALIAELNKRAK